MSYYDRKGQKIELMEWAKLVENAEYKQIRFDQIGSYRVSTIWLGLDYNFFLQGPPVIFETMVFKNGKCCSECDEFFDRYTSEESAIEGHEKALKQVLSRVAENEKGSQSEDLDLSR